MDKRAKFYLNHNDKHIINLELKVLNKNTYEASKSK